LLVHVKVKGARKPTTLRELADLKEDQQRQEISFLSRELGRERQIASSSVRSRGKASAGSRELGVRFLRQLPAAFHGRRRPLSALTCRSQAPDRQAANGTDPPLAAPVGCLLLTSKTWMKARLRLSANSSESSFPNVELWF
jgi:hypothetical protein